MKSLSSPLSVRLSPLLVLDFIFKPSRKVFLPRPREEEGLAVTRGSFLVFSEELRGFLTISSSYESKLFCDVLTVGELGRDIALSKASSMERLCWRA